MKKINKKILISLFLLIILTISLLINNKANIISNLVNKQEKQADEEIELDNWEISTVFYDSSVDNGHTPLTEINWDASDGSYKEGVPRVVTVQINYKNTNTVTSYGPGELIIEVDNLGYNLFSNSDSLLYASQIVSGANDSTHTNYDWDFVTQRICSNGSSCNTYKDPSIYLPTFKYSNNKKIEEKANLEGSIQIEYTLIPYIERPSPSYHQERYGDGMLDSCERTLNRTIKATIGNEIESDEISLNYYRLYIHQWTLQEYYIKKESFHISSYDGLVENASDYYWVKYKFTIDRKKSSSTRSTFPVLDVNNFKIKDLFPEGSVVLDKELNLLSKSDDDYYYLTKTWSSMWQYDNTNKDNTATIYVGYLKSNYSLDNTTITNHVDLVGIYDGYAEESLLATDEITIDLEDYDITFNGDLYSFKKKIIGSSKTFSETGFKTAGTIYYQSLTGDDTSLGSAGIFKNVIKVDAIYTGQNMDIRFGDDLLYITDSAGNYRKLDDNEYYFSSIAFPPNLYNGNNVAAQADKYDCELWIRQGESEEYIKYAEFKNTTTQQYKNWTFSASDDVNAYYFIIKDARESIKTSYQISTGYYANNPASSIIRINSAEDIAEEGNIYNYAYSQIYINDVLQNPGTTEQYENFLNSNEIMQFDADNYGTLLQRDFDSIAYTKYQIPDIVNQMSISKTMTSFTQDAENEEFVGTASLEIGSYYTTIKNTVEANLLRYYTDINPDSLVKGYELYDLLPIGMELTSTEEEIKSNIKGNYKFFSGFRVMDMTGKVYTNDEWNDYLREKVSINIIENYKNTGRTYLSLIFDFSDNPLIVFRDNQIDYTSLNLIYVTYNYSVSYDSYFEYGKVYTNRLYGKYHEAVLNSPHFSTAYSANVKKDNGQFDIQEADINNDGSTNDTLINFSKSQTITSVISSNQDVTTFVKTNRDNYSTGIGTSDFEYEYSYRIRVRNGSTSIKNLVVYDSIESYGKDLNQNYVNASGAKPKWQGEFVDIDTSHAESKGYNVKVYYNESEQPGSLKDDNTWKEYSDSIDKSKVKSLAFEYLDQNNNPVTIPENSINYITIKMKAPTTEYKTFAYNGCWTEWNAIDPITNEPVDFITGINSNIVRVGLPSSVEPEDMDITLTKTWLDNSDSLTKRPSDVTYYVIANDDYDNATAVTFSGTGNTWEYTTSVPKYDEDGEEITYTIRENVIELDNDYKYVPEIDNLTATNTLYKNIVITKNWLDNNNAYLTRPSNVTVKVNQNGTYYKDLIITGDYSTNTWTGSLSVPVFDNDGNEYTYTVDEVSVSNYEPTCDNYVCTNLLTDEDKITIKKVWEDNNNAYDTRPDSISIHLKQNNQNYKTINLEGTNNTWESDEITVPMYDSDGVKYTYTIEENQITSYGLVKYDQATYKVTNTLKETTLLTIKKIWNDSDNEYDTRPTSLQITLLQNDNEYQTLTLSGDTNTWTTSIEVPKYDDNQVEYTYSIKEINDNLDDYQDITYSDDSLTVTNNLQKNTSITITKKWLDESNKYQTRPESLTVMLLQNGEEYEELELSGDDNTWSKEIEVPVYDKNYKKYTYTIKELEPLERYDNITYDQTNLTITNELTIIPKVTLYFTVLNGYVDPITNEIKYDEEGLKDTLIKHGIDPDSDYPFTFELENIETNETYTGKLSSKGTLEFTDIPYGEYKASEALDDLFKFVSMESIGEVKGVTFTPGENGGTITIVPTGNDIIYGAKIVNKIELPVPNPETKSGIKTIIISITLLIIVSLLFIKLYKEYRFLKV